MAANILNFIFVFFRDYQTIHTKCQILFSLKNNKKCRLSSDTVVLSTVMVDLFHNFRRYRKARSSKSDWSEVMMMFTGIVGEQ